MPYPNAVAITAQRLFTLILATLTIMLSSCGGSSGDGEGEENLLDTPKISISGSISDSLESTFDTVSPVSNNYELYSRYIGSAQPTIANAKATDVTEDDIQGTIVVLAVDQDYNVYTTKTDSARKFKLAIPPNKFYVIIFVNITGKQVGVLVHQKTLVTASYKLVKNVNLGEVAIIKTGQAQAKSAEKELVADYDEEKTKEAPKKVDEIKIRDKNKQTLFLLRYLALPTGSYSYVVKQGTKGNYQHLIKYYKQVKFKRKKYLAEVIVNMCDTSTDAHNSEKCKPNNIKIQNMYLNEFTSEVVKTAYRFENKEYHRLINSRELPLSGKIGKEVKSTQEEIKYLVRIEDVENKSYDGSKKIASVSLGVIATDNAGKQISDQRYWYAKNFGLIQQENPTGDLLPQQGKTIYVYNSDKSDDYGSKPVWFTDSALTEINKILKGALEYPASELSEMKIRYAGEDTKLQTIKSYINKDHRLEIAFRTGDTTKDSKGTVRLVLRNFATNDEFKAALDGKGPLTLDSKGSLALKWASALEVYGSSSWQKCKYNSAEHFFEVSWRDKTGDKFSISPPKNMSEFNCNGKKLIFDTADGPYRGTYTTDSFADDATSDLTPAAPTDLGAKRGDGKVDLTWDVKHSLVGNYYDIFYVYYHSSDDISLDNYIAKVRFDPGTRSATITDLTNGTTYYFIVTAIRDGVESPPSKIASATPKAELPAPTWRLPATADDDSITLKWNAVILADSYIVYYHTASFDETSDSGVQSKTDITTDNTSITGLASGTKYYFRVIARDADGRESKLFSETTATTKLQAPTNVKATAGDKTVDISWGAVTGATSYTVYYRTVSFDSTTDSVTQSKTGITTTSTSITGLSAGTKYYLKVEAINANNKGDKKLSTQVIATTIPSAPTGVTATAADGSTTLKWNPVTGAHSYIVHYHPTGNSREKGGRPVTTAFTIFTANSKILKSGTEYDFWVIAIDADGRKSKSSRILTVFTNLAAPTNVEATVRDKTVDISWGAVTGATSYKVYYGKTSLAGVDGTADAEGTIPTTTTNTSITDLSAGTTYYLRVAAINADNKGDTSLSAQVTALTIPSAPTGVTATAATAKQGAVDLSWDAVTGATSYTVYYSKNSGTIKVNSQTTGTNSTSITLLDEGTKYYFGVIAINKSGSSAISSPIKSATTKFPAPQPSAAASVISLAAVDLTWKALKTGVTGYKVYYAKQSLDKLKGGYSNYGTTGVGGKVKTIRDTSATGITIGDLSADTTYYFVVTASYTGQKGESAAPEVSADSSYIAELAIGGAHGCVRLNSGSIKCWGKNNLGQLGLGVADNKKNHTATSVDLLAKQLSAGDAHNCAIDVRDRLWCWGHNEDFRLGLIDSNSKGVRGDRRTIPIQVTQKVLASVSLVTAGYSSTCALAGDTNYCWGNRSRGALGDGSESPDTEIAQVNLIASNVKQFALGNASGCAIDASDVLWCWGRNAEGQVGNANNVSQPTPVKPKLQGAPKPTVLDVDGIYHHYCAVDTTTEVQCWGQNEYGELGIGDDKPKRINRPKYVLSSKSFGNRLTNVSKIATGYRHSCALIIGGSVRCWGYSGNGVIGTKVVGNGLIAGIDMEGINNAIDIAAGFDFTCVLLKGRASVECWGKNDEGQLGNGKGGKGVWSSTPVAVDGL